MSDLRDGDDCCDEKSPLVRPPPLLFSTPREEGGEEKSEKIWILLRPLSFWILLGLLSFGILLWGLYLGVRSPLAPSQVGSSALWRQGCSGGGGGELVENHGSGELLFF